MNWLDHTRPRVLDPHDVDLSDDTFYVPNHTDLAFLVKSIKEVGILNRPVVQDLSSGRVIPVLGRRRLQAAMAAEISAVEVLVVSPEMPVSDGFLLAFWDNAAHRDFDTATKAVVVKRLLELYPVETVARQFLPVLEVPPQGPRLERLRLLGELDERTLQWLADGRLREKTAIVMTRLAAQDRSFLLDLLEKLGMNANKNAEVVENLFDLSVCHAVPLQDLIRDRAFQAVLTDDNIPAPERATRFRNILRSRKFPFLVDKERDFSEWLATLQVTPNIKVRPAQSFESDEFTIEIRVSDRAEARRILLMLHDMK